MTPYTTQVNALILAGGKSSRMGTSKANLTIAQHSFLENLIRQLPQHLQQQVYISGDAHALPFIANAQYTNDYLPQQFQGPLSGIAGALQTIATGYVYVLSCDILLLPPNLLNGLLSTARRSSARIVYALDSHQSSYPLIALWHSDVRRELESFLHTGQRKVMDFIHTQSNASYLCKDLDSTLCNINTPAELLAAHKKIASEHT